MMNKEFFSNKHQGNGIVLRAANDLLPRMAGDDIV